ncbi:MAG: formylglycine-generating enzyme family protein [Acidobacteria bacterium]|nr:formylglycine-generating enzyme family protein [Acidobacteriota bacterium]
MRGVVWLLAMGLSAAELPKTVNDGYGEMLVVPAGAFTMGDTFGDGDSREGPAHAVTLDAYYIAKFEVTNGDWKKFLNDQGYNDTKLWPGGYVVPKDQSPYWTQAINHGGATEGSDKYPVLGMNWDAATAYCNWLSAKTGKKYRLPTEAEWEKAARGTDKRRFPWGNTIDYDHANYAGAQKFDTGKEVGSYPKGASPYGVMDMAGNVMEWCSDWYQRDYYKESPKKNPKGPEKGAYRVMRGGSFFFESKDLRTYARSGGWPSLQAWRMLGMRVVREP